MEYSRLLYSFTWYWRLSKWLQILFYTIAMGSLIYFITRHWINGILFGMLCFAALLFLIRPWKFTVDRSVVFLNEKIPEAQYSCGLLLQSKNQLSDVALLQYQKTVASIQKQIKKGLSS